MTTDLITNVGKEYYTEDFASGDTHTVLVYNDSTDQLSEGNDVADITTEPTNSNYARQSSAVSPRANGANYGYDNDASLSFDFSDQTATEDVDAFGDLTDFQSDTVASDGSVTTHLIANPAMDQSRDIGSIDSLDVAAGDINVDIGN